ncbi:MAG: hypothetical protein GY846_23255 [Deltaproteobacteria bacterium]|nr:hypothetical protein [Deltaproteobacteria bacterium]
MMMNLIKTNKQCLSYLKTILPAAFLTTALLMPLGPSWSRASEKVSWTAYIVAAYRAIAALHPDEKVRNRDTGLSFPRASYNMEIRGFVVVFFVQSK